jgi:hypothetical protein
LELGIVTFLVNSATYFYLFRNMVSFTTEVIDTLHPLHQK